MASVYGQHEKNSLPLASLSDYGVQSSCLPALEGVWPSEDGEILHSDDDDDDDLFSAREILARVRRVQPPRADEAAKRHAVIHKYREAKILSPLLCVRLCLGGAGQLFPYK